MADGAMLVTGDVAVCLVGSEMAHHSASSFHCIDDAHLSRVRPSLQCGRCLVWYQHGTQRTGCHQRATLCSSMRSGFMDPRALVNFTPHPPTLLRASSRSTIPATSFRTGTLPRM